MADGQNKSLVVRVEASTELMRNEFQRGEESVGRFTRKIDESLDAIEGQFSVIDDSITAMGAGFEGLRNGAGSLDALNQGLASTDDRFAGLRGHLASASVEFERMGGTAGGAFSGLTGALQGLLQPMSVLEGALAILRKAAETQVAFDRLNASLVSATGSSEKAAAAFGMLQDFAENTPHSLGEVVEAFTQLTEAGLSSSEAALTSYGNTASATGKQLSDVVMAVTQAADGQLNALEALGVEADAQGDQIELTFQGMTTTIGNSAGEIEQYLLGLGDNQFADAMVQRMDTLDGALGTLGETWDRTFLNIDKAGLGSVMEDAVRLAITALQELNASLESGQIEGYLEALGTKFSGWGTDVQAAMLALGDVFDQTFTEMGIKGQSDVDILVEAFKNFPENVRAFVQIMVVEVLSAFDKASAYATAFQEGIKALFTGDTVNEVSQRLTQALAGINDARETGITGILAERDATISSSQAQAEAADERRRHYDEEREARKKDQADRAAQSKAETASSEASTASLTRRNAVLQENQAQLERATGSIHQHADATAAAVQQSDAHTQALERNAAACVQAAEDQEQLNLAKARADLNKGTVDLEEQTAQLQAQAEATLRGREALDAYNLSKDQAALLAGKNAKALTVEADKAAQALKQNREAAEALAQAEQANGILDRLFPEDKQAQDYANQVAALNQAISRYPEKADKYREALAKLGDEYEYNREKATRWGKFTEGSVDILDDAFAKVWMNIDNGFEGFADGLKASFKQLLATLAHETITQPIIISFANELFRTHKPGGISDVWSWLFDSGGSGGLGGSSGSGGGLWDIGRQAYDAYNAWDTGTGLLPQMWQGFQTDGFSGAALKGINYYADKVVGVYNQVSSIYDKASAFYTSVMSSGSELIGGYGLQGAAQGLSYSSQAAAAGQASWYSLSNAAQGMSYAAPTTMQTIGGYMQAAGPWMAGIGGAIQGYQNSGVKGGVTGAAGAVGGYYAGSAIGTTLGTMASTALTSAGFAAMGAALGSVVPIIGTIIGAALGSMLGSSLFGGQWTTKDTGIQLQLVDGQLDATQYEYQRKKGGLFSSNKSRTRFHELDAETQAGFQQTFTDIKTEVADLYKEIGITFDEGIYAGLTLHRERISTKGNKTDEITSEIERYFGEVADALTNAVDAAFDTGLGPGLTFERLNTLVTGLVGVNAVLDRLNATALDASGAGALAAEQFLAAAGGLQGLGTLTTSYYDAFIPQSEQLQNTVDDLRGQFDKLNRKIPDSRDAFVEMVSGLNLMEQSGRDAFVALMSLAPQMDAYYQSLESLAAGYQNAFLPETDRSAQAVQALRDEFSKLHYELPETREGFRALVDGLDLSKEAGQDMQRALYALAPAMNDYLTSLENQATSLSNARQAADQSVQDTVGNLRESIFMDMLGNNGAKYDYAKAQAETLASLLPSLTSVTDITDTVNRITQLTSTAYGLLDDQGKQTNGREMIEFLNQIQTQAQGRIEASQEQMSEQQAQALEEAINRATDRMATEMSLVIREGNTGQADLRAVLGSMTEQLSNALRTFGRTGREVTG